MVYEKITLQFLHMNTPSISIKSKFLQRLKSEHN